MRRRAAEVERQEGGGRGFSHGASGPADPLREVREVTLLSR